jgi:YD repeat-containing protein
MAVFALLLLAVTTAPLIEASPAQGSEEPPVEGPHAPDFAEIERAERERGEWLLTPEAESQREASRTAYTNLSTSAAQGLLLESFPDSLKRLNADPARFLSELEIEESLGTYEARVSTGEDETALVESAVPVESDLGGEGKEPVDLALEEESGGDFVPQNPLTKVELPGAAEEPLQLQGGVEVALPASDDHGAEPLGDKNLFYPQTDTSTDTLLAPVAGGVEVFEQLRSPESPEQFSFAISLPPGASLRESEEGTGAEVISASEETIESVPAPSAVDAQGTEVPVTMSVEGDSLLLEVPHRSRDVAYPLLLDPEFLTDSPSFVSGEWFPSATADYTLTNMGSSLSAVSKGHVKYGAGTFGQWVYTAPGETTYIEEAAFSPVYFFINNCATAQPYGYTGITQGSSKTFKGGLYSGTNGYLERYSTGVVGGLGYRYAVIGVGVGEKAVEIGCAHELYSGGVTVRENDPEPPTISSVSGVPSGWFDSAKAGAATIVATDPGVGLEYISITDGEVTNTNLQHCSGLSGNRCPRQLTWPVNPPYVKGESTLKVSAEDALANSKHVTNWSTPTKVDTTAPAIDLSGQFAEATDEEGFKGEENEASENQLPLPVYNLAIKATDGNESGTAKERQSGVKNIEVFLDGVKQEVPWKAQGCTQPQGSCKMEETYQLKLVGLAAGEHKLEVIATDQVDISGKRPIEFEYVPATGIKDDYVMQHFLLPDGEGSESEEEEEEGKGPELAVNVVNGNLVYHQRDVEVSGAAVDLELERFYNSQLPEEENSEWGEGWTLAQTPKLEPEETKEEAPPQKASMLRTSGTLARAFSLPTEPQEPHFASKLGATITKGINGGYEVADQSGKTANSLAFNASGRLTEERTPGYAKIEYGYKSGKLSEVAVHDPTVRRTEAVEEESGGEEGAGFEAPAYFGSFGGESSGPGRLAAPAGVATDSEGNVWAADTGHSRVQEFNSKGEFLSQFGAGGANDGLFYSPRGLAIDSKGNIWVADALSSRVQEFNSKGEFIRKFGSSGTGNGKFNSLQGVAVDPEGHVWAVNGSSGKSRVQEFSAEGTYITQFGISGTEDGQLKEPRGIAIDPKGNIWIADTENNRIQEFNSKGEFIRKFGSLGSGNGQLKSPSALAIDSEGNVWVTDAGNNRIEEFSSTGTYISQVGTVGNKANQFAEPQGIALDAKGGLWVADTGNDRVQELSAGEFVRRFGGEGSEGGQLSHPSDTAVDPNGNLWVLDQWHNRVQEFDPEGKFLNEFGAKGSDDGLLLQPSGLGVDSEGNVWVADAGNYRIEEFNSKGEFVRKFGSKGTGNGKFTWLNDVAVDPQGRVWAIDDSSTISRIEEFNSKGEYLAKFGSSYGSANGQFWHPHSITADSKGNIWVADSINYRVQEFNSKFEFVRKFGNGQGSGNGQFVEMRGVTVGPEGNVWVADSQNNRVQEFSGEGTYLGQFGTVGNNDGQFYWPEGVAVDAKGNVWVADAQNNRVQEIAGSEFIRKFGGGNSGAGQLSDPEGVAADSEGNVWVADTSHARIQEFDAQGKFIQEFGSFGTTDGLFYSPHGIAIDANDNVWVADSGNHRLQEFDPKGDFIRKVGNKGKEGGQFESLEDVTVDVEGNLWTVDSSPPRVQEFNKEGKFLKQFVFGNGSGNGEFEYPEGIAIDANGNIWVSDSFNGNPHDRIQELNSKGEFIRKVGGEGTGNSQFKHPTDLSFDLEGNLWVVDTINDRIQVFSSEGAYLGQFGAAGANDGQFDAPMGIALDAEGNVWIADTANDRLQRWQIPRLALRHSSIYLSSVAAVGSGGGQLEHPGDVALDSEGNIWVTDEQNNRIEEFDEAGEFLEAFGKNVNESAVQAGGSESEKNLCTAASGDACQAGEWGSGNGYLSRPTSLAIDAAGDIWVADAANDRLEKFSPDGKYLSKFGSYGEGAGQFFEPEGIALDANGNIWVSDTYNGRLQEFDEAGKFIRVAGSYGFNPGQLGEPTGIDIGPWGHIWVADWLGDRVVEFDENGKFIRQFGTEGTANGQFSRPDGLTIDDRGELWVADESDRVQAFTEKGEYVGQFGSKGSGEGQFKLGYPIGMSTDSKGNLWITDSRNNRVQQWGVYDYINADEPPTVEDAPEVEVAESAGGLVEGVEGEEAGQTSYAHKGQMLTAVDGPKGETAYEYDGSERLTKVTLPNGTWGQIQYDSIGRVKSVTVSIEGGKAKTTHFEYSSAPLRTVVEAEGEPTTTYDIGADGSVLRWWDAPSVPAIEEITGSLYTQRVEVNPEATISPGDQTLVVPAFSVHGIASIQLIANGNQLITEKTCKQDYEVKGTECEHEELSWVTEAENWPPGILQLEAIATDSEGHSSSERFSDNVPYVPPPDPEVPEPPKFSEVKKFREEYGLDLDLKGNEQAINERIFQLIADWHDPSTPQGEVARATQEKWGVPLRAADAAELEYREWFYNLDAERIDQWVEETKPSSFAGYYIDHRAGGIMHIGFVDNQAERLASLEASLSLVADERLQVYPVTPTTSYLSVQNATESVLNAIESNATLRNLVVDVRETGTGQAVHVRTPNVAEVEGILNQMVDPNTPVIVEYDAGGGSLLSGRYRNTGRMRAGDAIFSRFFFGKTKPKENSKCTAGFGAKEKVEENGKKFWRLFVLTAGHCSEGNESLPYPSKVAFFRSTDSDPENESHWKPVGSVARDAYHRSGKAITDAAAIEVTEGGIVPEGIWGWGGNLIPTAQAGRARIGNTLCYSGVFTEHPECGPIVARSVHWTGGGDGKARGGYWVDFSKHASHGDSGAPVWRPVCRNSPYLSVGLVTAGRPSSLAETLVEPLLHPYRMPSEAVPGILDALGHISLKHGSSG